MKRHSFCLPPLLVGLLTLIACDRPKSEAAPTGMPTVTVSLPVERAVTEYAEFIGRTEAVDSVEVKCRVTGYILETPFKEGSDIEEGAVLCQIDPRTYEAQRDAAAAEVLVAKRKFELAETENKRAKDLYKQNPQAISLKALDQRQAEEDAAAAEVAAAEATKEVYELDVLFTKVTSPIAGRVGRYQVTKGNLVTQNATTITTVVSQDPIYVYFNIDENTMLRGLRKLFAGKLPPLDSAKVQVGMALQDEEGFPHKGTANFADNQVDPTTGTLTMRASFANPANKDELRLLMPGMFVRVRLPLSLPEPALLVADQAVGTDQGEKFLYVVNSKNNVVYRRVTLGPLQEDGLRVIRDGLQSNDRVIVSGLQMVQPKMEVKTEQEPMPTTKTVGATGTSNEAKSSNETGGSGTTEPMPVEKDPAP